MSDRLVHALTSTEAMTVVFGDDALVSDMIRFEVALAAAQAASGGIPHEAAEAIARAAGGSDDYDILAIARAARVSATPAIAFVQALTSRVAVADAASARFVHFGATSQDVTDTALALALARARVRIAAGHRRLVCALVELSDAHAHTVMLGRTLLQPAPPTTFGLKSAGWAHAAHVAGGRMLAAFDQAACLQCGGSVGTRVAFGPQAQSIVERLADALGLARSAAPWHAQRDRLGALMTACGLYVASLAKMARDVALLMQDEVREATERGGGSSTMPHKRNPAASAVVLAAAVRLPGLVSSYLTGMIQEHERGVGGLQAEWATIVDGVSATASALEAAESLVSELGVFPDRMRANLDRTGGVVFAERVTLSLAPAIGRDVATRLVTRALERSRQTGEAFADLVRALPEAAAAMSEQDLASFDDPQVGLGDADALRQALVGQIRLED